MTGGLLYNGIILPLLPEFTSCSFQILYSQRGSNDKKPYLNKKKIPGGFW